MSQEEINLQNNLQNNIDLVPVARLEQEFGCGSTVLSDRRKLLGIKSISHPENKRKKYITHEQYLVLGRMNSFIKSKQGNNAEFVKILESEGWDINTGRYGDYDEIPSRVTRIKQEKQNQDNLTVENQLEIVLSKVQEQLVQLSEQISKPSPTPSYEHIMHRLRILEEISQHQYAIATEQLLEILDLTRLPSHRCQDTGRFQKFGFWITPTSRTRSCRHRNREWKITKI